jgi:hypothetical protein
LFITKFFNWNITGVRKASTADIYEIEKFAKDKILLNFWVALCEMLIYSRKKSGLSETREK